MTATLVLSDDAGPVRVLTMNRPAARNALSPELIETLYGALSEADDDSSVRAVVLTGADPAFCAGVDLKAAQRLGSAYFEQFQNQSCIRRTAQMRKPIVGAINGAVFTGGLEMALGCDFLVASERAVFADTHARVGILPGGGMTARLPQVVGAAMARRLSMTCEVVDAARAERIGLVTRCVADDSVLAEALAIAERLAAGSRTAVQWTKRVMNQWMLQAAPVFGESLALEMLGFLGPDANEGIRAVRERRPPDFPSARP